MSNWRSERNCIDTHPKVFFSGYLRDEEIAKAICASCSVRKECLQEAQNNGEDYGIWGGLNPEERFKSFLQQRLQDRRLTGSQHSIQHESTHLASESLSSPSYTLDPKIHTPQVSQKPVVWRGLF